MLKTSLQVSAKLGRSACCFGSHRGRALLGDLRAAQAQPALPQVPDFAQSSTDITFDEVLPSSHAKMRGLRVTLSLKQVSEFDPNAARQIKPVIDNALDITFLDCVLRKNEESSAWLLSVRHVLQR